MSIRLPKGTHCLKPMKYHGTSIKNTCCYQLPSKITKPIGIYDHLRFSPIGQSLLLTLA